MSDLFVNESKTQAKQLAYEAVAKLRPQSTSLVEYQSRGHVLIIGSKAAIEELGDLPEPLTSEAMQIEGDSVTQEIIIEGSLGQFVVKVGDKSFKADLVLDITPTPILSMGLKPPGYIESNANEEGLAEAKQQLVDLVGTFEKPKYFEYNASICAHGRSGKKGCTKCIDACPAEAITSLVDKIQVDPYRCHGGGACATACPSGAITYSYPRPKDMLNHVRTLIITYLKEITALDGETTAPDLVFVTEDDQSQVEQILPASLIITVEEIASVGAEVWLSALAWGARSVYLFNLSTIPDSSQQELDTQLDMCQTLLSAMGYPSNSLSQINEQNDLISSARLTQKQTAVHAALGNKRQAIYMAIDHLAQQAETILVEKNGIVELKKGAMFGEAIIDQTKCTLCMSCVSACPANALQDGNELPQVSLVEANCLQCGVCVNTCPEDAMTISPRLLLDSELRKKARVLHQDEPFCCTKCGKPFATTSGIANIMVKLAGHSMFADERSRSRLKMCDDCRVVDMIEDPDTDFG